MLKRSKPDPENNTAVYSGLLTALTTGKKLSPGTAGCSGDRALIAALKLGG